MTSEKFSVPVGETPSFHQLGFSSVIGFSNIIIIIIQVNLLPELLMIEYICISPKTHNISLYLYLIFILLNICSVGNQTSVSLF